MKINVKDKNRVVLGSLNTNDVFEYDDGGFWMISDEYSDDSYTCVSLITGAISDFSVNDEVVPVEAELIITK